MNRFASDLVAIFFVVPLSHLLFFQYLVNEVSGVPIEHIKERVVRVARATKNAMQSGTDNTEGWVVSFDNRPRWENDLMGWVSR